MGADLLIYDAWIKRGRKPNISKAEKLIARLGRMSYSKWPKAFTEIHGDQLPENPSQMAEQLRADLAQFLAGTRGELRDVSWTDVGPYRIYMTGGLSHGDAPTDSFDVFDRLRGTGTLRAMGFYKNGK